jgi:hypothetical protein
MTENGYKNWEDSLTQMIEEYPKWKDIAETTGYEFAMEQSSDKNIEKVTLALYEKLIEDPYLVGGEFEANLKFP